MERSIELILPYQTDSDKSIDKELVRKRFSKVTETYSKEAYVQKQIAEKMSRLVSVYIYKPCRNIIEIGCGTGFFSHLLIEIFQPENFILNDICPEMENKLRELTSGKYRFLQGDAETISFPRNMDGIFSCSTYQWFQDINQFFSRCHEALNKDGYLAFSTFGEENMKELTSITGKGLSYYSKEELENMLSEAYELIYTEEEKIELLFNSPTEILRHLKLTGVNGIQTTDKIWTKKRLREFYEQYEAYFKKENRFPLTYHPIYMIWKKGITLHKPELKIRYNRNEKQCIFCKWYRYRCRKKLCHRFYRQTLE